MNNKLTKNTHQRGFTLIELLIGMAVAGVLATTVAPSVTQLMHNNQIRSAQENVAQALRKGKHEARTANTNIRVVFTKDSNTIELKRPNNSILQTIKMSSVEADTSITFQFNSTGTVNQTGTVTLKSSYDASKTVSISIDSLFGQISLS